MVGCMAAWLGKRAFLEISQHSFHDFGAALGSCVLFYYN